MGALFWRTKVDISFVSGRMEGTTEDMLDMTCKNYEEGSEGEMRASRGIVIE